MTDEVINFGGSKFSDLYDLLARSLIHAEEVDVGEWHAQDVKGVPALVTRELTNVELGCNIPDTIYQLQLDMEPNLPWAEKHFLERVGGEPLNPPPSAAEWPYAVAGNQQHMLHDKFSHTYPERMWPKRAGMHSGRAVPMTGIRYMPGDLQDVVDLLVRSPYTRQAYLPIFFPEDTGNVSNVRTPCSLGYHFMLRDGKLNCTYFLRSCDFVRHFRDDLYMAARLCQWILTEIVSCKMGDHHWWEQIEPGTLTSHIISLHCMTGDLPKMRRELNERQNQS